MGPWLFCYLLAFNCCWVSRGDWLPLLSSSWYRHDLLLTELERLLKRQDLLSLSLDRDRLRDRLWYCEVVLLGSRPL